MTVSVRLNKDDEYDLKCYYEALEEYSAPGITGRGGLLH